MSHVPDSHGNPSGVRMLDVVVVAAACAAPFLVAKLGNSAERSDGAVWLVWVFAQAAAAFGMALWRPAFAMLGATMVIAAQPILVFLTSLASGEIGKPTRSTGGMAEVCIVAGFTVLFAPVPMFAAWLGRRESTRAGGAR